MCMLLRRCQGNPMVNRKSFHGIAQAIIPLD